MAHHMSIATIGSPNLSYQNAPSVEGGSYTENKLRKLGIPQLCEKRFLDLGCNTGFYCNYALLQQAKRAVGIDIDSAVIRKARELHPGVEFFDTGWDDLPNMEFDVIICLSAMHYAADPIKLVDNVKSHLASDGLLIIEGGLIDVEAKFKTDVLIPGWRRVGDRCRHLSRRFVDVHLLREFHWKVFGPSEPRGGDNVPRHVIHAVPGGTLQEQNSYQFDLVEYAKGLALSSETITQGMPSYGYVRQLGAYPNMTSAAIASVLSIESHRAAFMDDLLFAIGERRPLEISIHRTLPEILLNQIMKALNRCHVTTHYCDHTI